MKMKNRKAAAASLLLAAGLGLSGVLPAMAQGDDTAAEEVVEAETEEVAECVDDADCVAADEVPAGVEEGAAQEPPAEGAVVVVPGSTEETQPGGSTRPGTTPDD